eukprot:gene11656-13072_t
MDSTGRYILLGCEIPYLARVNKQRFRLLCDAVQQGVHKSGDWCGVYNNYTQELFVMYHSKDSRIGKKYVMGNALKLNPNRAQSATTVPNFDLYRDMFNPCDHFNRGLHDRSWPYKQGGHGKLGDGGNQDNFAFSVALQNTFSVHSSLYEGPSCGPEDFKTMCINLSDQLFAMSM